MAVSGEKDSIHSRIDFGMGVNASYLEVYPLQLMIGLGSIKGYSTTVTL